MIGFAMAWLSYKMYYPPLIRMAEEDEEPSNSTLLEPLSNHQLEIDGENSEPEVLLPV